MIYSHTSLALWNLCKRRWYHRYVLGQKEPPTINMAYSTHMVHGIIEEWIKPERQVARRMGHDEPIDFKTPWKAFQEEVGLDDETFNRSVLPLFTVGTSERILTGFRGVAGAAETSFAAIENRYEFALGQARYVSKPDFIWTNPGASRTVDLKFETSAWPSSTRPWPLKPLSPFNDQLLGQAIAAGTDGFVRITFQGDRKSGKVNGPIIEERLVDAQMRKEWLAETEATIAEIERWLASGASFPKNDASDYAFGRLCSYYEQCKLGFQPKQEEFPDAEGDR